MNLLRTIKIDFKTLDEIISVLCDLYIVCDEKNKQRIKNVIETIKNIEDVHDLQQEMKKIEELANKPFNGEPEN
jgi:NRPS condensation-like uncharacterized protein